MIEAKDIKIDNIKTTEKIISVTYSFLTDGRKCLNIIISEVKIPLHDLRLRVKPDASKSDVEEDLKQLCVEHYNNLQTKTALLEGKKLSLAFTTSFDHRNKSVKIKNITINENDLYWEYIYKRKKSAGTLHFGYMSGNMYNKNGLTRATIDRMIEQTRYYIDEDEKNRAIIAYLKLKPKKY